jgi:hypothetical protein
MARAPWPSIKEPAQRCSGSVISCRGAASHSYFGSLRESNLSGWPAGSGPARAIR